MYLCLTFPGIRDQFCKTTSRVCWTGWLHDLAPTSPDVSLFLLEVAELKPSTPAYSAWAIPLLAGSLANAIPTPSHDIWLRVTPPLLCPILVIFAGHSCGPYASIQIEEVLNPLFPVFLCPSLFARSARSLRCCWLVFDVDLSCCCMGCDVLQCYHSGNSGIE